MKISQFFRSLPLFKGKIRLASFILKKKLNRSTPISLVGKYDIKYSIPNTVDFIGKELYINGIYEKKTIKLIEKKLRKESPVFFDVGANIGSICLPIAKLTNAQVHAFEPSSFIFDFLKTNITRNNLKSIFINQAAVHSVHRARLKFYATEEKYGGSSLSPTYTQNSYEVDSVSLDEYCSERNINQIDVLKIDVQGFELEVLKGCQSLLQKKAIGNIIFEMEEWAENQAGFLPGSSQSFLIDNGYIIYTLKNKKLETVLTTGSHIFFANPGSDDEGNL